MMKLRITEIDKDDPNEGYMVDYVAEGFKFWIPKDFYDLIVSCSRDSLDENFSFGKAIALLKAGKKVSRKGWNGKGMFLQLRTMESGDHVHLPYIEMSTVDKQLVPWLASQTDMLAGDWFEYPNK